MKKILIFSLGIFLFTNCGTSTSKESNKEQTAVVDLTNHPGYKLYQMYCIACHGGTQEPGQRLAPPAFMVQDHYKKAFSEEEFKQRIIDWVPNTSKEKSIMPGAVRNFDIMPPIPLSLEDRQQIADYFWQTTFEEPAWAASHMQQQQGMRQMMMDSLANKSN